MRQWVPVDRRLLFVYLGVLGAGCRSEPGPLLPVAAQPVTRAQVLQWALATHPPDHLLHRFKWLFKDERASAGGRGSARIAPPDSLRFDVAGPFGSGAASAVVIDDRPAWMEPPDAVAKLVPNYPLMWAMFGIAEIPAEGVELRGLNDGDLVAWQYAGAVDTVVYARRSGEPGSLSAEVRQAGKLIGRVETTLDPDGSPVKSRLTVPSAPAQLDLTFLSTDRTSFAPDIWAPRRP